MNLRCNYRKLYACIFYVYFFCFVPLLSLLSLSSSFFISFVVSMDPTFTFDDLCCICDPRWQHSHGTCEDCSSAINDCFIKYLTDFDGMGVPGYSVRKQIAASLPKTTKGHPLYMLTPKSMLYTITNTVCVANIVFFFAVVSTNVIGTRISVCTM